MAGTGDRIRITDHYSGLNPSDKRTEIIEGLKDRPMRIPSKYFYDSRGSSLFRDITRLEEYYPARTEKSIMRRVFPDFMRDTDVDSLVELGSGDCSKISILLSSMRDSSIAEARYVPVDVSRAAIERSCTRLSKRFPELSIRGLVADFCSQLRRVPEGRRRLFCLFGSTLGNFSPGDAAELLSGIAAEMEDDDRFMLGLDMQKEPSVMESAYNDGEGVTASFNGNILRVAGRILSARIPSRKFDHLAFWNDSAGRMEMHLVAREYLSLESPHLGSPLEIDKGERIHTENSYKYTEGTIEFLAEAGGMEICRVFTDRRKWFSLVEMKAGSMAGMPERIS